MPSFFRLQMRDNTEEETVTSQVLAQNRITAGVEYADDPFSQLPSDAIIMVHRGGQPVALVKPLYRLPEGHGEAPSFGIDYRIEILSRFNDAERAFPQLRAMRRGIVFTGTFRVIQSGNTYRYTSLWYHLIMQDAALQKYRKVLEFKRQLILEGPPGTGKTRLAKQIAAEMTKSRGRPRLKAEIDEFFENFDATPESVKQKRARRKALLDEFQKAFPPADLVRLSPERYANGTNTKDTFCYWLQYKLNSLIDYDPGSSGKYLLYWNKNQSDWVFQGDFLKDIKDPAAAMQKIAPLLDGLVREDQVAEALESFDSEFVLKVLHSYHPEKHMPIIKESDLNNALRLLGEEPIGMNAVEKNRRLQALFEDKKKGSGKDVNHDEFKDFLYTTFGLKEEVIIEKDELVAPGAYTLVQFHPAYSYEDFVRGIVAKVSEGGHVFYETEDKTLALLAQRALDQPAANFVLIIDEINRANLPAVLGELIYALEYRYDPNQPSEPSIQGLYAVRTGDEDEGGSREIRLPKNLYIIGTMNSADRSIGYLDYAIRRRFAFEEVLPSVEVLETIKNEPVRSKAVALFGQVAVLFGPDYLAADYTQTQVQPGHSYFLAETEEALNLRLDYEIRPLLREYLKGGVLRPEADALIKGLHV